MHEGCHTNTHEALWLALQLISAEDAACLLSRSVRATSGLSLGRLARPVSPLPMELPEPGRPLALSPSHPCRFHSQDISSLASALSSSSLSGAGSPCCMEHCAAQCVMQPMNLDTINLTATQCD